MVGSDVKKIFEIISCKRAKKHLPDAKTLVIDVGEGKKR